MILTALFYPVLAEVMQELRVLAWWLSGSGSLFIISGLSVQLFMQRTARSSFHTNHQGLLNTSGQLLLAGGCGLLLSSAFIFNYQDPKAFYTQTNISERWTRGLRVRGIVETRSGMQGQYYVLTLRLSAIGSSTAKNPCTILYAQPLSFYHAKRMRVKIKATEAALQTAAKVFTPATQLLINPYYYLSTKTVKTQGYQNYLYHKQQLGTFYVRPENITLIKDAPFLRLSSHLEHYVQKRLSRFIRKNALTEQLQNISRSSRQQKTAGQTPATTPKPSSPPPATAHIEESAAAPAALSAALISGDRSSLPAAVLEQFRLTGTYHVLAVSGMHTSTLIIFCITLLMLFPISRIRAQLLVICIFLPLYVMVVGPRISILRSVLMSALAISWLLRDRSVSLIALWGQAFIILSLLNPHYLYQISFQLSFSAVFGVGMALRFMQIYRIRHWLAATLLISSHCQLFTAPFILYYFGVTNPLAPFYNLLIPPAVMLSLSLSLLIILLPSIFTMLLSFLGSGIAYLNSWILKLLHVLSENDPNWLIHYPLPAERAPTAHYPFILLALVILSTTLLLSALPIWCKTAAIRRAPSS